ncbi:MAG: hypothetical protein ACI8QC_002703 [Planctomycetota bacterium]|jgi:hypothetical protein
MSTSSLRSLALGLLLSATSFAAPSQPTTVQDLDHADLAQRLLERHHLKGAIASTFDFTSFLKGDFVSMRLGLFDLHMETSSIRDKEAAGEFKDVAQALLGLQEVWLDWTRDVSKDQTEARADLKELQSYVKRMRAAGIVSAAKSKGDGDLYARLGSSDAVVDHSESFASFMASGACLGLDRPIDREPMVIVPERGRYLEFISFAGWLRPEIEEDFWHDGIINWTNCYIDEYRFLALRFPAMDGSSDGYMKGLSMNARTDNGLQQQIAQLAALSLLDNYYGAKIPPALAGGLSVMLTVDQFGECNTKVDGDLSERRTEAYEMFVPGGQSEGGILATNFADSRWRKKQGADFFKGVLRQAQKAGAKEAKRIKGPKNRHFELENDTKNKRVIVSGPFLGSGAADISDLQEMYHGERAEFLRSYRTGFLHWLRTASMGKSKASAPQFAQWLQTLADPQEGEDFEAMTKRIFGDVPLSDKESGKETLEGRFLAWISK